MSATIARPPRALWSLGAALVLIAVWQWLPAPFLALARWQRQVLGSAFPATTVLAFAALVVLPMVLAPKSDPAEAAPGGRLARVWRLRRFRFQAGLAAVLVAAAGIGLLPLLWARDADGPARTVDLDNARAIAAGPVELTGFRAASGELRQVRGGLGGGSAVRYLAVVPARAAAGTVAHVVVQLRDDGLAFDPQTVPATVRGIAMRNALPAAATEALRGRGVIAPGDVMVVFTDPQEPNRPTWQLAEELLLVGGVLAAVAAFTAWRGTRAAAPRVTRSLG